MFWFILLIVGICSIASILFKTLEPILGSLALLGIYLFVRIIVFLGKEITKGDRIERFFSSLFSGIKFIYFNIKFIAIGSIVIAIILAGLMLMKSSAKTN